MLLRNALSLTPCLALFLLACNDKSSYQPAQPQAAPAQVATQKDPAVTPPISTPTDSAKPTSGVPTKPEAIHRHHLVHAAHHTVARNAPAVTDSAASAPAEAAQPSPAPTLTVPTGTVLNVRLTQELGSKTNNAGDAFTAIVSEAVLVDGKPIIPEGSVVSGKVMEAKPMAMLRNRGVLHVTLSSISLNGQDQAIQTSTVSEIEQGESEHASNLVGSAGAMAAPAAGLAGASQGAAGLAGAGQGAAGLAGAGQGSALAGAGLKTEAEAKAGTVVAALTGKDLVFPAQAAMKFTLEQNLDVKP